MELGHLRDFVAIAEELSLARAAAKLRLAQPSLSIQIRNLEDEIGVRLLERTNGHVSLTKAGGSFLADAKRVLALAAQSPRAGQRLEREELNIGYVADLHYHLLPATLNAFRSAYPNTALNLFDLACAEQLQALREGTIDLGFIGLRESLVGTSLRGECVARYDVVVALPKGSPLARTPNIDLRKLETLLFVGLSEKTHPGWRNWMQRICQEAGFTPRVLRDADDAPAILGFVASGMGVALLSEQAKLLSHDGVVFRRAKQAVNFESCMAWRSDNRSRPLEGYLNIVRDASQGVAS